MEWLESDGFGGFAMGNASAIPSRRYHSLLTSTLGNPARRVTLVNAVQAELKIGQKRQILSSFQFAPGTVAADGLSVLHSFECSPWPTWVFKLDDDIEVVHELFISRTPKLTALRWQIRGNKTPASLFVRPLLSVRDYHSLHRCSEHFNFTPTMKGSTISFQPYSGLPIISVRSNGTFLEDRSWFMNLWYENDRDRGSEYLEDLAVPGQFCFDLKGGSAVLLLQAKLHHSDSIDEDDVVKLYSKIAEEEARRRKQFPSPLHRAADDYIVARSSGKTVIAGYPWFADWGRDTFISMRGLCLAGDRLSDAESILLQWTEVVSEGMLPNRFLEHGEEPEYNSVDASLWFIVACYEFLTQSLSSSRKVSNKVQSSLTAAITEILNHYTEGTRYNIKCDLSDGLLRAGQPGVQLTWMDAKIGDYVVTPRIGKPVEIQALWINALKIGALLLNRDTHLAEQAEQSFQKLFWNQQQQSLYDVCDVDHHSGQHDASIRPNQIFAVGGLPFQIISGERAAMVVQTIQNQLYTPYGLRTLTPSSAQYRPHYSGNPYERDTAYHQGTVWPWLMGAFVEAWIRVHGTTQTAKKEARARFLEPLLSNLNEAGLGHISEIVDADPPHLNRGCPFQAWSVGEALRIQQFLN